MTLSDPPQLSDPHRLPPREVCLLRPLTSQFPGPPQNKARRVPSGAALTASTNTLSEEEQRLGTSSTDPLQMSLCLEISAWKEEKKSEKKVRQDLRVGRTVNKLTCWITIENEDNMLCGNVQK